ncbi:MAG TPA: hypothetical protein VMM13_11165, partial [Euzebya sp.]|nr:hypothetical protein [Euzebya sp.]
MDLLLAQAVEPGFTVHAAMGPLHLLTAVVGALYGARTWRALSLGARHGARIGAGVGVMGPLLITVPLRGCTFQPGRDPVELWLGVVLALAASAALLAALAYFGRLASVRRGHTRDTALEAGGGAFRGSAALPMALLAPTLAVLAIFLYWPALETVRLSTRIVRLSAPNQPFVCLANFNRLMDPTLDPVAIALVAAWGGLGVVLWLRRRGAHALVGDLGVKGWAQRLRGLLGGAALIAAALAVFGDTYRRVFATTLILSAGTVAIGLALGLGIAWLAFQPLRGQAIYRTFLIWPYAISPPIAGVLFFVMFDPIA